MTPCKGQCSGNRQIKAVLKVESVHTSPCTTTVVLGYGCLIFADSL